MRPRLASLIACVVVVGLVASGCAGGDSSSPAPAASSGDARAILAAIAPSAQEGPQKVAVSLDVALDGAPKDPKLAAFLGSDPITMTLSGPVDPAAETADLRFSVSAGKIDLSGAVRAVGDTAFVRLGDAWYALPAGAEGGASDGTPTSVDPGAILDAIGDPSALVANAEVVGTEEIDGIPTDHIRGEVDTAGLAAAIGRLAGQVGGGAGAVDPAEIRAAAGKLGDVVTKATVELWVGRNDRQIHRLRLDATLKLDDETAASTGLKGLTVTLSVSSTPTASPVVEAPAGALPADRLAEELMPLLLAGLGGATP